VSFAEVADRWWVVAILLVGSLPGAWLGAASETRMPTATLYRVLGGLMAATAVLFALPGRALGALLTTPCSPGPSGR
jgi:uncharacterized membrane protein YfcA